MRQAVTYICFYFAIVQTIFLDDGILFNSKYSFSRNIGNDGSGVHSEESCAFGKLLTQNHHIKFEIDIREKKPAMRTENFLTQ